MSRKSIKKNNKITLPEQICHQDILTKEVTTIFGVFALSAARADPLIAEFLLRHYDRVKLKTHEKEVLAEIIDELVSIFLVHTVNYVDHDLHGT